MQVVLKATNREFFNEEMTVDRIESDPQTGKTCLIGATKKEFPVQGTNWTARQALKACFDTVTPAKNGISNLNPAATLNEAQIDQASPVFDNFFIQRYGKPVRVDTHDHSGSGMKHDATNPVLAKENDGRINYRDVYFAGEKPVAKITAHWKKVQDTPPTVKYGVGSPTAEEGYPQYIITKIELPKLDLKQVQDELYKRLQEKIKQTGK